LDFAGVENVDSTAFACLISLIKYHIQDPNKIGVFNLNPQQKSLIEILQVHKIINIFPSEDEAIGFFTQS
jgi:anti-anti-sigma regulatory factor